MRRRLLGTFAVAAFAMTVLGSRMVAEQAEIKVLSLTPLRSAVTTILPQFEQASGHRVAIDYAVLGPLMERLEKGEADDVVIVTREAVARLQHKGRITPGSQVDIARVGMGVLVRAGAERPDIGSVDAFSRALLAAKSIAYIDPASGAPGGIYLTALFERLGIAAELKPKTRHLGPSGAEAAVAKGEVELGLSQITLILAAPGVELVGPLPAEIQNYLQFTAGIAAGSKQAEAGRAFIQFLSSPAAAAAMKAKGFE